jgi:hypothetical protein
MNTANLRAFLAVTRARWRNAAETYMRSSYLPAQRRDDDLFLVEFPKSGVTWLTFLFANLNLLLSNDVRRATFFNINDFVPDVEVSPHLDKSPLAFPGYRCFKSHSPYTPIYRKVIYLVRDPRHVMVSYWSFLTALGWWHGTLEELIRHPEFGIKKWRSHVETWFSRVDPAASFAFIKYEDLLADTRATLRSICQLLGLQATDEVLSTAIARSSLEEMRDAEVLFNSRHPALSNIEFVRRGKSGGARHALAPETRQLIETEAASLMRRLGYTAEAL